MQYPEEQFRSWTQTLAVVNATGRRFKHTPVGFGIIAKKLPNGDWIDDDGWVHYEGKPDKPNPIKGWREK